MLSKKRFSINRITCPSFSLKDFFSFTAGLGLSKVELRNDLSGKPNPEDIIDGLKPGDAASLAKDMGIEIISINALQKFNLPSMRKACLDELARLLDLAARIDCKAIVLCPNNDIKDKRAPEQKYIDTVISLRDYGPLFVKYGIAGYVEALGFGISSAASLPAAMNAIKASGYGCYRIVYDTFHHHIGPDTSTMFGMGGLGASYETTYTGLVHISGVEAAIDPSKMKDEHRVLVGPKDRMDSKGQVKNLVNLGYLGDFSFEPFAKTVQKMKPDQLAMGIKASMKFLGA